ncbi:MAG: GFA family protein [Rhodospirillaceae bacterium]|nr:GFA family protein [Rhodospirillaceae bacterium]
MPEGTVATGGCLCGAVRYTVRGPLRDVVNCHCGQCRRFHGHIGAYTESATRDVAIDGEASLRWFRSSPGARRGFCQVCGSSLFWQRLGGDRLSIAAGTLDAPTGLRTVRHIFTASAGDYYRIEDSLEKLPGSQPPGPAAGA